MSTRCVRLSMSWRRELTGLTVLWLGLVISCTMEVWTSPFHC